MKLRFWAVFFLFAVLINQTAPTDMQSLLAVEQTQLSLDDLNTLYAAAAEGAVHEYGAPDAFIEKNDYFTCMIMYPLTDIVVVDRYIDKPLIKRVVAVAGDVVEIDPEHCRLILNGVEQDDPYPAYPTLPYEMDGELFVPEGYIFVLGDHRDNSHDSRYEDIGLVREEDVVGRAVWRLWPRMGLLK